MKLFMKKSAFFFLISMIFLGTFQRNSSVSFATKVADPIFLKMVEERESQELSNLSPELSLEVYSDNFTKNLSKNQVDSNESTVIIVVSSFFIAVIVAGATTTHFVRGMNQVQEKKSASEYLDKSGFSVTLNQERFLTKNVVKIAKQQSQSGHGGGGRPQVGGHPTQRGGHGGGHPPHRGGHSGGRPPHGGGHGGRRR